MTRNGHQPAACRYLANVFRNLLPVLLVLVCSQFDPQLALGNQQGDQQEGAAVEKDQQGPEEKGIEDHTNELFDRLSRAFSGDLNAWGELAMVYLVPALAALAILIIGYAIAARIGRAIGNQVTKRVDVTLGKFSEKVLKFAIFIVILLGVLGFFGFDVTSIAALLAAAGFAIGMALQGTLSNFASGIMILVFRPFKVGDVIDAGGASGKVHEISLFTTSLNTPDNRHLIVPNNEIFGSMIENKTAYKTRRVDVAVGVDYSADIQTVRDVLLSAAKRTENVHEDPEPVAVLSDLGDSAVNWVVRAWCDTDDYWSVKEQITEAIKYKLDASNIGIPYQTFDVNVKKEAA